MELLLVAIKDTAIDAFQGGVHTARQPGEAMRNFTDMVNDPNNKQIYAHPDNFEIWILGTFEDTTGKITPEPRRLARGQDVKN